MQGESRRVTTHEQELDGEMGGEIPDLDLDMGDGECPNHEPAKPFEAEVCVCVCVC